MTVISNTYATPSGIEATRERDVISLAASAARPITFRGKIIRHGFVFRTALQALGKVLWSRDVWMNHTDPMAAALDPTVTVHPDRVIFEAFSQDMSAYGALIVDRDVFAEEGQVTLGTTNVEMTAWLVGALGDVRSSRETWLKISPEGTDLRVTGTGGRLDRKVDVPDVWIKGFLQVQGCMAMPGTRMAVRPVDFARTLELLHANKAAVSARAMRFVLEPGQEAKLVLEPWELEVALKGATHAHKHKRSVRVWGRRRLKLMEYLLPYAKGVDVCLRGRGMPSFYSVKLPGMTFVLGVTGWGSENPVMRGSLDLLTPGLGADDHTTNKARETLTMWQRISEDKLAQTLGVSRSSAGRALERLCRQGRAMYDLEAREYRHRELFAGAIDEAAFFEEDARAIKALGYVEKGRVQVYGVGMKETRRTKRINTPDGKQVRDLVTRDWDVKGKVGTHSDGVEVIVDDFGHLTFGRCMCSFYRENLLIKGPCEHMLALIKASEGARPDLPTNVDSEGVKHMAMPRSVAETGGPAGPAPDKEDDEGDIDDEV
jgi:hypothetical protein